MSSPSLVFLSRSLIAQYRYFDFDAEGYRADEQLGILFGHIASTSPST